MLMIIFKFPAESVGERILKIGQCMVKYFRHVRYLPVSTEIRSTSLNVTTALTNGAVVGKPVKRTAADTNATVSQFPNVEESGLHNFPADRSSPASGRTVSRMQLQWDAEPVETIDDADGLINDVIACDVTTSCRRCKFVTRL